MSSGSLESSQSVETRLIAHRTRARSPLEASKVRARPPLPTGPKKVVVTVSHGGRPPLGKRYTDKGNPKIGSKEKVFVKPSIEVESVRSIDTPADLVFSFSDTNNFVDGEDESLIEGHVVSTTSSCVRVEVPNSNSTLQIPSQYEDEYSDIYTVDANGSAEFSDSSRSSSYYGVTW